MRAFRASCVKVAREAWVLPCPKTDFTSIPCETSVPPAGKAIAEQHWLVAREPPGQVRTLCPTQPTVVPGDVTERWADAKELHSRRPSGKTAGNVAPFEDGDGSSPSTNATHMARAYQPPQPLSLTTLEVAWQRRPRARQIPVQFVASPPPRVEPPSSTLGELPWLSRHMPADEQGQS